MEEIVQVHEPQAADIGSPKQKKSTDQQQLADADYRRQKREDFENAIRCERCNVEVWISYAKWEESQKNFNRARFVWERALEEVDYRDCALWLKYGEMEMDNSFINLARCVWDRAVSLLPMIDELWYKYIEMEEVKLGNVDGARQVFERWMNWIPDEESWISYVQFELRYKEIGKARCIFESFVECHNKVDVWIRYAKFEIKYGEMVRARSCYERAVEMLADDGNTELLFVSFAQFEEQCNEFERARCIYNFALDHIPKGSSGDINTLLAAFEDFQVGEWRFQYEEDVRMNPLDYDSWFDYIKLEENAGNKDRVRETCEGAIAHVPPTEEKQSWQPYVNLWIYYALYEELDAGDMEHARDIYMRCLKLIPHETFSFAKIWLLAALLEIRRLNLKAARDLLDTAIIKAPKNKIFRNYIDIEFQFGNIDQCRSLYKKYLEWSPENYLAWCKYAEFEITLFETERARAIFELGVSQPTLNMPDRVWKAYIEFEMSEREFDTTRKLYERLLHCSKHLKVWTSYAKFEECVSEERAKDLDLPEDDPTILQIKEESIKRSRGVFERALRYYQTSASDQKEERLLLLEEWKTAESRFGSLEDVKSVQSKMPKILRKRFEIEKDDGTFEVEERTDYLFPEEAKTVDLRTLVDAYRRQHKKDG